MKISKAIEILTEQAMNPDLLHFPNLKDSILLSIEALKRIKNARDIGYSVPADLLPGEDPE
ncbi:hypothetical protein ES708_35277 [subsurface metagenome]